MKNSHLERWYKYRIADMVGVFVGCLMLAFLLDFDGEGQLKALLGSPLVFIVSMFFWYGMTLYLPLRLLELALKITSEDRVIRFLLEPGFMLAHAIVVFYYLNGDFTLIVSKAAFMFTGFVFLCNFCAFIKFEKEGLSFFDFTAKV